MSRLLFAAARGARIEMKTCIADFEVCFGIPLEREHHAKFRIHPDDEHLQYGPISSALREIAANPGAALTHTYEYGTWSLLYSDWCNCTYASTGETPLFLLILAEALADEGL